MGFSEYLEDKLGNDYQEANEHKVFRCPFCYKNHDHKLYVNISGGERDGLWDCKRCGRVGNPVGFVMEYEDVDFRQAKSILEDYGVTGNEFFKQAKEEGLTDGEALYLMLISRGRDEEDVIVTKEPPPLPTGFKLIMDNLENPEVKPFIDYIINQRGIDPRMISKHNMGYVKSGKFFTSTGKEVNMYNHIIFLTYDFEGKYIYWNTRSIETSPYLKSINASGTEEQYGRADVMFNFNGAINLDEIVLTEGVFDALTVGDKGISGFGKQYSKNQIKLLKEHVHPKQKIYILLDRDAIITRNVRGEATTLKLAEKLYEFHEETYIVIPETDEDPNDLGTEKVWNLIRSNAVKATPEGRILLSMI